MVLITREKRSQPILNIVFTWHYYFDTFFFNLEILSDIQLHQELYAKEADSSKRQRALLQIQRGLIRSQEIEDDKLQLVASIMEHIEGRARQLEQDLENLGKKVVEKYTCTLRMRTSWLLL